MWLNFSTSEIDKNFPKQVLDSNITSGLTIL